MLCVTFYLLVSFCLLIVLYCLSIFYLRTIVCGHMFFEGSNRCAEVVFCWIVCPYRGLVNHIFEAVSPYGASCFLSAISLIVCFGCVVFYLLLCFLIIWVLFFVQSWVILKLSLLKILTKILWLEMYFSMSFIIFANINFYAFAPGWVK